MTLDSSQLQDPLPQVDQISASTVSKAINESPYQPVFIVLDDDPTGTQSVANLPVITSWKESDFDWVFSTGLPAVYVMTNSRSLDPADAEKINREVVRSAMSAASRNQVEVAFISRSDSTLRGHFPLEPEAIADELAARGVHIDGVVLIPAFPDAGRITVHGTHYAGSMTAGFTPVADTEFARDASFGYTKSVLAEWVEEKTGGDVSASAVIKVDIDDLRRDHPKVVAQLLHAHDRQPIVCDATSESDLRAIALALIEAEAQGKRFIYSVGPPFGRARIGQAEREPLSGNEIVELRAKRDDLTAGGLIVVGSHVSVTSRQLARLSEDRDLSHCIVEVPKVIDPTSRDSHIAEVVEQALAALERESVVVSTSRERITGTDEADSLRIARDVSSSLIEITQRIFAHCTPRFVIAKGGITSSDIATHGLGIRRAMAVGSLQRGIISLWLADDGLARGIPYVVFAGNVGDDDSLIEVVEKLSH